MTEWSFHPEIVNRIFGTWVIPTVDMFATVHNTHLRQIMFPIPEPRALAIDALSQDWQERSMNMFPPFPLLNKVIQKLRSTQEGDVILIVPWWQSQPWFPHLLRLYVDHPRIIPYRRDLMSQQGYVLDGKSCHLHAWRLSCSTTKHQNFQKRSAYSWNLLEDPQQTEYMTTGGIASLTGLTAQGIDQLFMVAALELEQADCPPLSVEFWFYPICHYELFKLFVTVLKFLNRK